MKNSIVKLFGILAIASSMFMSCADDENGPSSTFVVDANNLQGMINDGEVVLNSNTVYKLTGRLQVNDGAILTIPAGTRIEATGVSASYIAVAQGG